MTTAEAIELALIKGMNIPMKCKCGVGFLLRDLECAQPQDLAKCPECHSTMVEVDK